MRTARIKAEGAGHYHCITRIIERTMRLGDEEKYKFTQLMRQVEEFSGVRILTHACLSNHCHILLYVPERGTLTDAELISKLKLLYSDVFVAQEAQVLKQLRADGLDVQADELKERWLKRMWDVSEFMKTLKQRFSMWYNRRNGRKGTLWEERFKSVLVESSEQSLGTMAAYIDLNPVRAGIVADPKDYRFSGYGEAVAGVKRAREGLRIVMQNLSRSQGSAKWTDVGEAYRKYVYVSGGAKGVDADGRPTRPGFSAAEVEQVLEDGGKLPLAAAMLCRIRYMTDGVVLGSKQFVDEMFEKNRTFFSARRTTGARPMKWSEWGGLCTARDLRQRVIDVSAPAVS
jgi:REP element-mobilizing transposase RayT